jgi:hypothetical protein
MLLCSYQIGYLSAKLEKPSANTIFVQNNLNENVNLVSSTIGINVNQETILYISSDVKDKDNETLNRIGVRFIGFQDNKDLFLVEICDSINKKCIQSDIINRIEVRRKFNKILY